jgi:hypothetical protein
MEIIIFIKKKFINLIFIYLYALNPFNSFCQSSDSIITKKVCLENNSDFIPYTINFVPNFSNKSQYFYFNEGYEQKCDSSQLYVFNKKNKVSIYRNKYIDSSNNLIDTLINYFPLRKSENDSNFIHLYLNFSYIFHSFKEPLLQNQNSNYLRLLFIENYDKNDVFFITRVHFFKDSAFLVYKVGLFNTYGNIKIIINDSTFISKKDIKLINKLLNKFDINNEPIVCESESYKDWLFEISNNKSYKALIRNNSCIDCRKSLKYLRRLNFLSYEIPSKYFGISIKKTLFKINHQ